MMRFRNWCCGIGIAALTVVLATTDASLAEDNWPRFRGVNGLGVASSATLPLEWSDSQNVQWQLDLPGCGASSPIVWGDRVYLTAYTGYGEDAENPGDPAKLERHLLCVDRAKGHIVWTTTVRTEVAEDPYKGFIHEHGYASSTPVTDGQHIFAFFGKDGVYAFDMGGELVWHKSVGVESDPFKWGGGSSPVLFDNLVIVNAGNEGSAIVAFDKADGREVWRVDNESFKNSWSTPLVVEAAGRSELVFIMPDRIFALDPRSGAELWTCTSPISQTVCASLTAGDGVVYAMGGRGGRAIAVRCGGSGDVTETHIVWDSNLRAGIDTPVLYNGRLYWQVGGQAVCASAETGEELYNEALAAPDPDSKAKEGRRGPAGDYASPIVVGDKVLLVMRSGAAYVLEASGVFQVVSSNSFADDPGPFHATPAFADGQLFLRSYDKLYCIGAQ